MRDQLSPITSGTNIPQAEIEEVLSTYEDVVLQPRTLRRGDDTFPLPVQRTSDFDGQLRLLRRQLGRNHPDWRDGAEGQVRGWLLQRIAPTIFERLLGSDQHAVVAAPPIFDATIKTDGDKGADLFLLKRHPDGTEEIISCLEVTSSDKADKEIGYGVNKRLGFPIPVIMIRLDSVPWTDAQGRTQTTKEYLHRYIREPVRRNRLADPLWAVAEEHQNETIAAIQRCVLEGCNLTRRRLESRRFDPAIAFDLFNKLQLTEQLLAS